MSDFLALNTKIDGIFSKLFFDEDYERLEEASTFREVIDYFNNHIFFEKNKLTYDISYSEAKLGESLFITLNKLKNFTIGPYREFITEYLRQEEINSIKKALRFLKRESEEEDYIFKYQDKSFSLKGMTIKGFVEKLKNTIYYRPLATYEDEPSDDILFYMEMNLDKLFFNRIIETVKKFSKEDQREFINIFGRQIDILNILWIYRGTVNYRLLPEELLNFVIFGGKFLSFNLLKEMCYLDNRSFLEVLEKTPYRYLFTEEGAVENFSAHGNRLVYNFARSEFRKTFDSFGHFLSFIIILENQIKDLKIFMESHRLNLGIEKTSKYLVKLRK